ncbi:MAG: H-NS histone family protein, partial [Panacagrimonas sp.]
MKYKEIVAKIESLSKQAEELRKAELSDVIEDIKSKMADYGLTVKDIAAGARRGRRPKANSTQGAESAKAAKATVSEAATKPAAKARPGRKKKRVSSQKGVKVPPKYRHPQTGEEWSGRGRKPRWLQAEIDNG